MTRSGWFFALMLTGCSGGGGDNGPDMAADARGEDGAVETGDAAEREDATRPTPSTC